MAEGIDSPIPKKKRKAAGGEGEEGPSPYWSAPPTDRSQPQSSHFPNVPAALPSPATAMDSSPPAAAAAANSTASASEDSPQKRRHERKRSLSESLAQSTADILFGGEGPPAQHVHQPPHQPSEQQRGPLQTQESNWSTASVGAPTEGSSLPSDGGTDAAVATLMAPIPSPGGGGRPSPKKLKMDRAALAAASSFERTEPLKGSESNMSLPLSGLGTPREDEAFANAGGDGAASDVNPMDAIRRLQSAGGSSFGEQRKRKTSAEEDILLGESRNSSSASLPSEGMPEGKKVKTGEGTGEEKKEEESCYEKYHRPAPWSARRNLGGRGKATTLSTSAATYDTDAHPRWRTHQMAEDYISLASAITLPPTHYGTFGYSPATGHYPLEQATALGYLTSPVRRPTVVEKWSPIEIATFEAALALHGKTFHRVQKWVKTKNTKEIVEFYYVWKKTSHGRRWKSSYVEEMESESESEDGDGKGESPARGR